MVFRKKKTAMAKYKKKKKNSQCEFSFQVAGTGFEPATPRV